jgi:hypothetical protein
MKVASLYSKLVVSSSYPSPPLTFHASFVPQYKATPVFGNFTSTLEIPL